MTLIFGVLLTLLGAVIGAILSMMAYEAAWNAFGQPAMGGVTLFITFGVVAAFAMTAIGYFTSKQDGPPSWYLFITGALPGALLFFGWRLLRKHFAKDIPT